MKKAAHIAFIINEQHVPYLAVSLYSLLYHSSPDYEYHIHVLLDDEGKEEGGGGGKTNS